MHELTLPGTASCTVRSVKPELTAVFRTDQPLCHKGPLLKLFSAQNHLHPGPMHSPGQRIISGGIISSGSRPWSLPPAPCSAAACMDPGRLTAANTVHCARLFT